MVRAFNALLQDEPRVRLLRYAARRSLITHHLPRSVHGTLVGMMREARGSMGSPARQTSSPCAHGCRCGRQTRAGIHSWTVHHPLSHRSFLTAKKWGNAKWQDWRLVGGAPRGRHDADPGHIVEQRGVQNKHGGDGPADVTTRLLFSPRRPHQEAYNGFDGFRLVGLAMWLSSRGLLPATKSPREYGHSTARPLVPEQPHKIFCLRVGLGIPARSTARPFKKP